ncbi:SHOCT domain-containing protein [Natronobiforma cellulositropha]|uniref:SHOCT domain-containing protein n=1 Tax=Natronobiforma cellulositropha TaxID=1679076 RepID=UPI0021D595E2|nr:SHOCT domain-containing protein [Natronobiforma cellulositropha]
MNETTIRFLRALPAFIAVGTLPLAMLLAFVFGVWYAGAFALFMWVGVLPLTAIFLEEVLDIENWDAEETAADADRRAVGEDPLETIRERYARGEIDDEEFERRLEALLETDDGDPTAYIERRDRNRSLESSRDGDRGSAHEHDDDREPSFER